MERERHISPEDEPREAEREALLDEKIDLEARRGELLVELREAEFPTSGVDSDEAKVSAIKAEINEIDTKLSEFN